MRLSLLRRILTWLVAALLLAGSVAALAVVWTADERQWYVDSAGIDLTLDVTLTPGGRLALTVLLIGLMALALATMAVELISRRAHRQPEAVEAGGTPAPVIGRTFTYRTAGTGTEQVGDAPPERPRRYDSTIVGKTDWRRSEGKLPADPPGTAGTVEETETVPPGARRVESPAAPRRQTFAPRSKPDVEDGPVHSTIPLRGGGRR